MEINRNKYVLNGLLAKGLYLSDEKQLIHYVNKFRKAKKMNYKQAMDSLIDNTDLFIKWIIEDAFKFLYSK